MRGIRGVSPKKVALVAAVVFGIVLVFAYYVIWINTDYRKDWTFWMFIALTMTFLNGIIDTLGYGLYWIDVVICLSLLSTALMYMLVELSKRSSRYRHFYAPIVVFSFITTMFVLTYVTIREVLAPFIGDGADGQVYDMIIIGVIALAVGVIIAYKVRNGLKTIRRKYLYYLALAVTMPVEYFLGVWVPVWQTVVILSILLVTDFAMPIIIKQQSVRKMEISVIGFTYLFVSLLYLYFTRATTAEWASIISLISVIYLSICTAFVIEPRGGGGGAGGKTIVVPAGAEGYSTGGGGIVV